MSVVEERTKGYQLVQAAATGRVDLVRQCLDEGADIHFEKDLALRSAAFTGHLDTLKLLVDAGADVSAVFHEALLYAAKRQDRAAVDYLLDHGAEVAVVLRFHTKHLDADTVEALHGRLVQESHEVSEKNQALIRQQAESARQQGLKLRLNPRPPSK